MSKKDDKEKLAPRTLSEVLDDINSRYGASTLIKASNYKACFDCKRIPTGVFQLDYAMGGGIPIGRFTMLKGYEGTGKSTIAMMAVRTAQKTCRFCYAREMVSLSGEVEWIHQSDCPTQDPSWDDPDGPGLRIAYVDVEGTFLSSWASTIGVDTDKLYLSQPEYAEQAIDIIHAMLFDGVIDLVVLDSVASLAPKAELEKSVESDVVGVSGRLLNRAFREWGSAMNRAGKINGNKPTVIFINQIRLNIGTTFGNPETIPGGKGQLFAPSIVVMLRPRPPVLSKGTHPKPLRWVTYFKIEKNKTSVSNMSGEYELAVMTHDYYIQGDVVDYDAVLSVAKETGVVRQEKKKWIYDASGLPGDEYRIQDDMVTAWKQNFPLYSMVKHITLRRALDALT